MFGSAENSGNPDDHVECRGHYDLRVSIEADGMKAATDVLEAIAFVHLDPPDDDTAPDADLGVLRAQVEVRGGTVVKLLPSGCLLAFPSASSALDWARRELERDAAGRLRIGVSVGDEDGAEPWARAARRRGGPSHRRADRDRPLPGP